MVRPAPFDALVRTHVTPLAETQHKTEAERILATLSNMRTSSGTPGLSPSYSSRTLRKQISIPAPSEHVRTMPGDPLLPGLALGQLKRAREVEGSVMVSPYGKRRRPQRGESEEAPDEAMQGGEGRMCESAVGFCPGVADPVW